MRIKFYLNEDKVNDLYKKAEEIFANIALIKMFCYKYKAVDDFFKVIPILNNTYEISDLLYTDLCEIKLRNTVE